MAQKVILLADDEQVFVEALADALVHEGYRVVTATSGADALTIADKEKVDLAVVDIMMPPGARLESKVARQETGVYVIRELRRLYPKLPVFCLSVISEDATVRAVQAVGARYFRKGETPLQTMLDRIEATLRVGRGAKGTIRRWTDEGF
jgi:CheY-like chemotaxis protein